MDKEYLNRLKKMREEVLKNFKNDEYNSVMMKEGNLDDNPYNSSTFLYIRAFNGDDGNRPIPPGIIYCLSPDIEIYLNGAVVDTDNPLLPDTKYTIQVTVTNDGDLGCNICTVDVFLCEPSLGFSTKGGQLIGITNTHIDAHSKTIVEFPFTTTKAMGGHRCMFARAYSLVSNDYPSDLVNFNTYADRHIGQQNLNIVKQGESFEFVVNRVIRDKGKEIHIVLKPDNSLFDKNNIISRKYTLSKKLINTKGIKLLTKNDTLAKPDIKNNRQSGRIIRNTPNKINEKVPSFNEKSVETKLRYIPVTKRLKQGGWVHKINSGTNKMKIEIPMLGLEKNEAIPTKLSAVDPVTGESIGEITVIVVA